MLPQPLRYSGYGKVGRFFFRRSRKILGPDDADALIDVMAFFDFVDHGDGVVGIGNIT